MRAIVVVLCAAIAVTVAFGRPALAEPPFIAACGLIRAFTPPSPTAPGSITVGVRTSALTAADHFAQAAFGGVACLNQRVTTSGPVLEVVAVPVPFCGEMLAVGPESLDIRVRPGFRMVVRSAPGFVLAGPGVGVSACFDTGLNAAGELVVTRQHPAGPSMLPSTSTADPFSPLWLSAPAEGGPGLRP